VDPAYCDTLGGLYSYLQRQLIRAHAEKSESLFQEVRRLLCTLLEGWIGAIENLSSSERQGLKADGETPETVRRAGSSLPYGTVETATSKRSWQF